MQLAGPLAQQLHLFRINAADQFLEKRTGRRCFTLKIGFALQHALVVAADGVQRERPDVAFIGDRALQETNDRRLRLWPAIFDCSDERWHVWKIGFLGQESRDFDVGIHAVLEFAIEFQEKFVVEEHRRVALFRAQDVRVGGDINVLRLEARGCEADKLSCLSSECADAARWRRTIANETPRPKWHRTGWRHSFVRNAR